MEYLSTMILKKEKQRERDSVVLL